MAVRYSADGQDHNRAIALGTQASLSFCCWFKQSVDRNDYSSLFFLDNGTGDNWGMQTGADGSTMATVFDASTQEGMGAITTGVWYWVMLATSGTTGFLYYKTIGSPLTVVSVTSVTASVNAATLRIGESPWGAEWWNGCIAAPKLWLGQLGRSEAECESQQYAPTRTANLAGAWHQLRPDPLDYSGNGRSLAGGAGATYEDGPPIPLRRIVIRPHLLVTSGSGSTPVSDADSATLAESASLLAISAATDSVTATETGQVTSAAAASDTATLADTVALTVTQADTDTAVGAEVAALVAASALADNSTLTDSCAVDAAAAHADTAALAELSDLVALFGDVDSAALADAASLASVVGADDTSLLTDAIAAAVTASGSDSGLLTEAVGIAGLASTVDSATFTDSSSLDAGSGDKADIDTAVLADAAAVSLAAVSSSDAAELADTADTVAAPTASDSATFAESVTVLAILAVADDHGHTETVVLSAAVNAAETAALGETAGLAQLIAAADAAALQELAQVLDPSGNVTPAERTARVGAGSRTVHPTSNRTAVVVGESRSTEV